MAIMSGGGDSVKKRDTKPAKGWMPHKIATIASPITDFACAFQGAITLIIKVNKTGIPKYNLGYPASFSRKDAAQTWAIMLPSTATSTHSSRN